MKRCPQCNQEVTDQSIVCRYCGAIINDKEAETSATNEGEINPIKICPHCKNEITTSSIICRYCGNYVQGENIGDYHAQITTINPTDTVTVQESVLRRKPKALTALISSLILSGIAFSLSVAGLGQSSSSSYHIPFNNIFLAFLANLVCYWFLGLIILAFKPKYKSREVAGVSIGILVILYILFDLIPSIANKTFVANTTTDPTYTQSIFVPTRIPPSNTSAVSSITLNGISCTEWRYITASDEKRTICVFGNVRSTSYSENLRANTLTFSASPEAFYFIMYGDIWFPYITDECIKAYGTVYTVYNTPYIEIDKDHLFLCED